MMKRDTRNLGIEIIIILVAFIFSILILSRFFVNAKNRSLEAAHLSDAVTSTTSNQGCPSRRLIIRCPTLPVPANTATGILLLIIIPALI